MAEPGRRFTSLVSCKWLIVTGVLVVVLSFIVGIVVGVLAGRFGPASSVEKVNGTDNDVAGEQGAQDGDGSLSGQVTLPADGGIDAGLDIPFDQSAREVFSEEKRSEDLKSQDAEGKAFDGTNTDDGQSESTSVERSVADQTNQSDLVGSANATDIDELFSLMGDVAIPTQSNSTDSEEADSESFADQTDQSDLVGSANATGIDEPFTLVENVTVPMQSNSTDSEEVDSESVAEQTDQSDLVGSDNATNTVEPFTLVENVTVSMQSNSTDSEEVDSMVILPERVLIPTGTTNGQSDSARSEESTAVESAVVATVTGEQSGSKGSTTVASVNLTIAEQLAAGETTEIPNSTAQLSPNSTAGDIVQSKLKPQSSTLDHSASTPMTALPRPPTPMTAPPQSPTPRPIFQGAGANEMFSTRPFWLGDVTVPLGVSTTSAPPVAAMIDSGVAVSSSMELKASTSMEDIVESEDLVPCPQSSRNITRREICDGIVQCPGAADEVNCTCRQRVNPARLCDGVPDCPSMEDEVGCNGCDETQFSCDTSRRSCIPLFQRCDGVVQCPDGGDEIGCVVLVPSMEKQEIFPPKFPQGIAFRNFKNKWYPVCYDEARNAPFASSICTFVTGSGDTAGMKLSKGPVDKQTYNGSFFDVGVGGLVPKCETSGVLNVKCNGLSLHCGRQAPSLRDVGRKKLVGRSFAPRAITDQWDSGNDLINSASRFRRMVTQGRIVGGVDSQQGEWPWVVAIMREGLFICGGTLLSSRWVLSAAHCFDGFQAYHYEVQTGMLRRFSFSPLEQTQIIAAVNIHPGYNRKTMANDAALGLVDGPFQLNQWTVPACLPDPSFDPPVGSNCTVIGWGKEAEGASSTVDSLRQVEVPIAKCKSVKDDPNNVVCAGYLEGGRDACQGDSGGPLLCRLNSSAYWTVTGIVSTGRGCARPDEVGIYARVTSYLTWIEKTMESSDLPEFAPRATCDGVTCKKTSGSCVPNDYVCDGIVDCLHAEDEVTCPAEGANSPHDVDVPVQVAGNTSLTLCSSESFNCSSNSECIDPDKRCNMIVDCADASDESACSCADYLQRWDGNLICDGHADCWDYSDEENCTRLCPAGNYFSVLSSTCIPMSQVCDDQKQTSHGDDESNCLTLVGDSGIVLDRMGKPSRMSSGVVVVNKFGTWQPMCAPPWISNLTDSICRYIGYGPATSYNLTSISTAELESNDSSAGVGWNLGSSSKPKDTVVTEIFGIPLRHSSAPLRLAIDGASRNFSVQPTEGQCINIQVSCSDQPCGTRPLFRNAVVPSRAEGQWPWHASIFVNGSYLCGATLVSRRWLVASDLCASRVDLLTDYVAALFGVWRFTPLETPMEQIRRIVSVTHLDISGVALVLLESPVSLTEYVNPICIAGPEIIESIVQKDKCVVVGQNGTYLSDSVELLNSKICNSSSLCASWDRAGCLGNSSGTVSCYDGHVWYSVAVHDDHCPADGTSSPVFQGLWTSYGVIREIITCGESEEGDLTGGRNCSGNGMVSPPPYCSTRRCPLGRCLPADGNQVCDGVPNCRDSSDESGCQRGKRSALPDVCSLGERECKDGRCVRIDRFCDGIADCSDGEDEGNCTFNDFSCRLRNQTGQSIGGQLPWEAVCDGVPDCVNEEDEARCVSISQSIPFNNSHWMPSLQESGYVVIRISGKWYTYCSDNWDGPYSNHVCNLLGFKKALLTDYRLPPMFVDLSISQCSLVLYLACDN